MKKIINLCPTGTQSSKENSLAPIQWNEVIDDVLLCYEGGITMVHLHARDEEGRNTYKKEVFQRILDGLKQGAPDLILGVSLSGRYYSDRTLRAEVLSLRPDFGSLTMSSLNFPQAESINNPETILWLLDEMKTYGVLPEIECFDSGMLNYTQHLIRKGLIPSPVYINIILGNLFNAQVTPGTIAEIKSQLPQDAKVCFGGIAGAQLKANLYGLMEADGVRIGLEDNFYLTNKIKTRNIDLLNRIHSLMHLLDMEYMPAIELKRLGYANQSS